MERPSPMLARLPPPPVPSLRRLAPIVPLLLATALTIGAASLTSALGHAVLATDPAASSHVSSGTASGGQASPFERARDVLASGLPLPAQPALAPDGVRVMTASQFYDVTGDDLGAVLASMRQNGPR